MSSVSVRTVPPCGWIALFICVALIIFPRVASAQDEVPARAMVKRATVRIISLERVTDGINYSTGTGFAVTPTRIVTNHHVIARDADGGTVIVVPSYGSEFITGRVVASDPVRDLAVIEVNQRLPVATLSRAALNANDAVVALGYPGNLDRAFAERLGKIARPSLPTTPPGEVVSFRSMEIAGRTIPSIVTNAQIGPGFSGGPLTDACGRVIGVNTAVPDNRAGDAQYGITLPMDVLLGFLAEAGIEPGATSEDCVPEQQRIADDNKALRAEMEKSRQEASRRELERVEQQRIAEAYLACRETQSDERLRLVLGLALLALTAGAAAGWAMSAKRGRLAGVTAFATLLSIAGGGYVLARPLDCIKGAADRAQAVSSAASIAPEAVKSDQGQLVCRVDPARTTVSATSVEDTEFSFDRDGCVNKRTLYWRDGKKLRHARLRGGEGVVSISTADLAAGTFEVRRWVLDGDQLLKLRDFFGRTGSPSCSASAAAAQASERALVEEVEGAVGDDRAEVLAWNCAAPR